jgi:hypothetical protein
MAVQAQQILVAEAVAALEEQFAAMAATAAQVS